MKPTRRPRLSVEQLEHRECPVARVTLAGSTLFITGPVTPNSAKGLQVTLTANNQMTVTDNGMALGKYTASNLQISAVSHQNSPINVDLAGKSLNGYLTIDLGNGDTSNNAKNGVALFSSAGAGFLGGNLTVSRGSGFETLQLGFSTK